MRPSWFPKSLVNSQLGWILTTEVALRSSHTVRTGHGKKWPMDFATHYAIPPIIRFSPMQIVTGLVIRDIRIQVGLLVQTQGPFF